MTGRPAGRSAQEARAAALVPAERIERAILVIRGEKVMLDSDLAELYGVETGALVRQVRRNLARFPEDFMFQLGGEEWRALKCQIGISKEGRGGRRYAPYVFTEQGVAMLSSVLRSPRAVQVNIAIMRAFVRLRELMATHKELAAKLEDLEKRVDRHDQRFQSVFEAIRQLLEPPTPAQNTRRIGFTMPPSSTAK